MLAFCHWRFVPRSLGGLLLDVTRLGQACFSDSWNGLFWVSYAYIININIIIIIMSESDVDDHGHGDCSTMHVWASWSYEHEY